MQLRLHVTRRSWQKLSAGKNFVKILVTTQTQLRSYSEQQRAFENSNICNCVRGGKGRVYKGKGKERKIKIILRERKEKEDCTRREKKGRLY